jgi:peptidyl-prolyl cis-trans isomerase A (cyclophilin A)
MVIAWLLVTALLQVPAPVGVLMQTSLGDIYIEVDAAHAPNTAANFLKYVDAGLYDGGRFHRTVRPENQRDKPIKIAVVQLSSSHRAGAHQHHRARAQGRHGVDGARRR